MDAQTAPHPQPQSQAHPPQLAQPIALTDDERTYCDEHHLSERDIRFCRAHGLTFKELVFCRKTDRDPETYAQVKEAKERREKALEAAQNRREQAKELATLKLVELGDEHGHENIAPVFSVYGDLVVYGRPDKLAVQRWRDALTRARKQKSKTHAAQDERKANVALCDAARLYPEREIYKGLVAKDGGLGMRSEACVLKLVELEVEEDAGKSPTPTSEDDET